MRYIGIDRTKSGMVLALPVMNRENVMLVKPDTELTTELIQRIRKFNIRAVCIFDESTEDITVTLDTLDNLYSQKKATADDYVKAASGIVTEVMDMAYMETNIDNIATYDNSLYVHSRSVAVYASMTGLVLGYGQKELLALTTSALLHDLGKTTLPEQVVNKPGAFTVQEFEIMKQHSVFGYKMLKEMGFAENICRAVRDHHRNADGSGYPDGSEKPDEFAGIIHVCDVYDAMVQKRCYKDSISPSDTIEYLYSGSGRMFDSRIVHAFLERLCAYPSGMTVILSDGREAVVTGNTAKFPLRPDVRYLDTGENIRLMENNSITIRRPA